MFGGLGKDFDICSGVPVIADICAGANTGHRVHMRNYEHLGILFIKDVASAGADNIVLTLMQHTAAAAGVSTALATIDEWYYKREASLDGDEVWVQGTQVAGGTLTLLGATYATLQAMVYISVNADQLAAGNEWVSLDIPDPGVGGTIPGAVIYIPWGLKIQRSPELLAQPNA